MAQKKTDQILYTGKGPLDAKSVVKKYSDLLNISTWTTTIDGKETFIAYNGMIVAVWLNKDDTTKNGLYFLFDPAVTSALGKPDIANAANWHRIGNTDDINTLVDQVSALETLVGSSIEELQSEDARIARLISDLNINKANAADVYTKIEVDDRVKSAIEEIPEVDLTSYAKLNDVNTAINEVIAEVSGKANTSEVYSKTEADAIHAAFITESDVDARINTLIAAADPEGGKVITNIKNLVKYIDENASDIVGLITAVNNNTADIIQNASNIAALDDKIIAIVQPKASEEITVDNDGTLGIKQVSTDKLIQGANTLVLAGGSATA